MSIKTLHSKKKLFLSASVHNSSNIKQLIAIHKKKHILGVSLLGIHITLLPCGQESWPEHSLFTLKVF